MIQSITSLSKVVLTFDAISRILWNSLERISRYWWWNSPEPDWEWQDRVNAVAIRARESGMTIQLRGLLQLWEAHEISRIKKFIDELRPQASAWPAAAQQECSRLIARYELLGQSHEAAVQRAFDEVSKGLSVGKTG